MKGGAGAGAGAVKGADETRIPAADESLCL